jgi:hypothetical protein
MKRSKKAAPKFTGELAAPIVATDSPFDHPFPSPGLAEQMKKFGLLAEYYGTREEDGTIDFHMLSWKMALDLVPGFEVLNDHPAARALDLPNAYRGKTNSKGVRGLPDVFSGADLLILFRVAAKVFPGKKDLPLAEEMVARIDPTLAGARYASDRLRKAKTLQNRMLKAKKAAKRAL